MHIGGHDRLIKKNKSNKYKITVVTICRNAGDVIEKTIQSVIEQDYDDLEYIIVDGASTDHTMNIVKRYAESYPIKYISERDTGIYNAMNKGVRMSSGDFIIFENAGDAFHDRKVVSDTVKVMKTKTADIYYGNCIKVYKYRTIEMREDRGKLKILLQGYMPSHQSIFSSRQLLMRHPFDESYKITGDLEWLLRCKRMGVKFCYMDRVICIFDGMGLSNKKSQQRNILEENRRSIKKYFPIIYFFRGLWQ